MQEPSPKILITFFALFFLGMGYYFYHDIHTDNLKDQAQIKINNAYKAYQDALTVAKGSPELTAKALSAELDLLATQYENSTDEQIRKTAFETLIVRINWDQKPVERVLTNADGLNRFYVDSKYYNSLDIAVRALVFDRVHFDNRIYLERVFNTPRNTRVCYQALGEGKSAFYVFQGVETATK